MTVTDTGAIVVVGGGHAGAQICANLVAAGLGRRVHLICEEPDLPYQRPPLSKSFLKNEAEQLQLHRGAAWFDEAGIVLRRGDPVVSIDRTLKQVRLASGETLPFSKLVLATGTRPRHLSGLSAGLENVFVLRTASDAVRLRACLPAMKRLTVLGGGFIGLEVAATARALGKEVEVLEAAPRLLGRSASAQLSEHVLQCHRHSGLDVRLGAAIDRFEVAGGRCLALSVDGRSQDVDSLLVGIGAVPETSVAQSAGVVCDNGVVVDDFMRSSDPDILAIGDCANFAYMGADRLRLESVQNANDQARIAAAVLLGEPTPYRSVPWFWSEQGPLRLQMAGLMPAAAITYRRQGASPTSFSLLHYAGERLACVESVNAPADHMSARKLLEAGVSPDPLAAQNAGIPLKSHIPL